MKINKLILIAISFMLLNTLIVNASYLQIGVNKNKIFDNLKLETSSNSKWTVMVYMDADNDLEQFAIYNFLQMSEIGSTDEVNIIVQFDRIPGYDNSYDDWTSAKRYYIQKNMIPNSNSALMDIGEVDMGNWVTLKDFYTWGVYNYPAENYCLILWDHGSGWKMGGDVNPPIKYICTDFTNGGSMSLLDLKDGLDAMTQQGRNKIDLICFDACLMQMLEVGYEIRHYADYMTASEEVETAYGLTYDDTLGTLISNANISADMLGGYFVNSYKYETMSTVDLQSFDYLKNAVSDLGNYLQVEDYKDYIKDAINDVETYYDFDFVDLYDFASLLKNYIDDSNVDYKADMVMSGVNQAVLYEKHDYSHQRSHGISIYMPYQEYDFSYGDISFAIDSSWDDFIMWYFGGSTVNEPEIPEIDGPESGSVGVEYGYKFLSSDPDDDDIYYYVEWSDGQSSGLIGPYPSGEEIILYHSWESEGWYLVRAKAVDEHGHESDWSQLNVGMPKNKCAFKQNTILFYLFEKFFGKITDSYFGA